MLTPISQRDPQWSNYGIGTSPLTIGHYGCTTCCISMLSSYFGEYKNPIDIQKFQQYTPKGLILWTTLKLPLLGNKRPFEFEIRRYGQNDAAIQKSIKDADKACILEIELNSGGKHWVVATGLIEGSNAYTIIDPWYGDRASTNRYGNRITGSAHYIKK